MSFVRQPLDSTSFVIFNQHAMSSTHRIVARRTLALLPTSFAHGPAAIPRTNLTYLCCPSLLPCRRYLSATTAPPAFSTSPIPATAAQPSSSDDASADSAAGPADDRWSHILDPHNPPKLTLAHYALLNKIPAKPTAAHPTGQPASSPTPGLDHAINSLQRMISTLGQSDPQVRQDLIAMQQQLNQPSSSSSSSASTASDSEAAPSTFFVPTTKTRCRFCAIRRYRHEHPGYDIAYTNLALLHQFINLRGMLYSRKLTGTCGRHQRQLTTAVKRARIMGLLAFTSNWRLPEGWADVEEAAGGGSIGSSGLGGGEVAGEVAGMVAEGEELSFLDEFDETGGDGEARGGDGEMRGR